MTTPTPDAAPDVPTLASALDTLWRVYYNEPEEKLHAAIEDVFAVYEYEGTALATATATVARLEAENVSLRAVAEAAGRYVNTVQDFNGDIQYDDAGTWQTLLETVARCPFAQNQPDAYSDDPAKLEDV